MDLAISMNHVAVLAAIAIPAQKMLLVLMVDVDVVEWCQKIYHEQTASPQPETII